MEEITRSVLKAHQAFVTEHLVELYAAKARLAETADEVDGQIAHFEAIRDTVGADLLRDDLERTYSEDGFFAGAARPKVLLRFGFDREPPLQ